MTCFMVSTGQGDPPMIPVDRLDGSKVEKSGWFSMSINMVGTPYNEVHLFRTNNSNSKDWIRKLRKYVLKHCLNNTGRSQRWL